MPTKITHVAVGILIKPNGEFLMASRPQGKPWAGWWEFPGGKIEAGETPEHALIRELQEELGITSTRMHAWLQRIYDYPATHDSSAKTVHLHFHFVTDWLGELTPHEGQQFAWQQPNQLTVSPVLPANAPIMKALSQPPIYAISNAAEMGEEDFLRALEAACNKGCRLVQVREKHMGLNELKRFAERVIAIAKPCGTKVLLNTHIALARELGADGVHLPSADLMRLQTKPQDMFVAASCHNRQELLHAQQLGMDVVTLSPVLPTLSHPNAETLGWERFAEMLQGLEVPVYALGGMQSGDIYSAWQAGARGVAMQRAVW